MFLLKGLAILASLWLTQAHSVISDELLSDEPLNQLDTRAVVTRNCDGAQADSVKAALQLCGTLAAQAAMHAAGGDDAQFARYFKTTDPKIRKIVSMRFAAVADDCLGNTQKSRHFCNDGGKRLCQPNWIAVTVGNQVIRCDHYWKDLPLLSNKCHAADQVTKTIHEMTHVEGLYGEITTDFPNNYGWPAVSYLSADQAYRNADNYAYYANAVFVGNGC